MEKRDGEVIFLKRRAYIQNESWSPLQTWPFKILHVNSNYAYLQL